MEDGGAQPLVAVWAWSLLSLLAGSSGGCWLGTAQLHATVDRPQFGGHHHQHTAPPATTTHPHMHSGLGVTTIRGWVGTSGPQLVPMATVTLTMAGDGIM